METVKGTQLLERTFSIIDLLAQFPKGLKLSDVSQMASLPKSTVHRILNFLIVNDYVRIEESTSLYFIGSKFALLSSKYMQSFDFAKEIRPGLEKLNKKFDETVHLGVLNNSRNMVVYIDKLESSRVVRMFSMVGQTVPIHCTALGKSLLASLPENEVRNILSDYPFVKFTENTFTDKSSFMQELARVRKNGYAMDNREHEDMVICFGKAFFNREGRPIASISISIPAHRYKEEMNDSLVNSLNATVDWIESKITLYQS